MCVNCLNLLPTRLRLLDVFENRTDLSTACEKGSFEIAIVVEKHHICKLRLIQG